MEQENFSIAKLTKEQLNCVNFDAGDLLIRGVAGSGKSYVILKRAVNLYKQKKEDETVTIFTYTNSLVKYTDDLITDKIGKGKINIQTVDSYCVGIYRQMTGKNFSPGDKKKYRQIIKETLDEHQNRYHLKHRFYDMNTAFFEDEFRWIREKCIMSKNEYIKTDRKGRGSQIRLSASDKELAWGIFALFMKNAKDRGYRDWPDLYVALNKNISYVPKEKKIDYVLIDEAQDMTVGKLRLLKALSKKSLTVAADVAQKIYKTSFTWKEVGIDVSGRSSKALSKSFRSTKQIVELAEDLMIINKRKSSSSKDYTNTVLPEVEGDKPCLVACKTKAEENAYLMELLKQYDTEHEVIGIICRTEADGDIMKKLLYQSGLEAEK